MVNPKLDWTVGRSLPFNDRSIGDRPPDAPASPRGSEGGVLGTNRSQSEGVVPPGSPIVPSVLAGTPRTPSDRSEKRGVGRGTTATWSTTRLVWGERKAYGSSAISPEIPGLQVHILVFFCRDLPDPRGDSNPCGDEDCSPWKGSTPFPPSSELQLCNMAKLTHLSTQPVPDDMPWRRPNVRFGSQVP